MHAVMFSEEVTINRLKMEPGVEYLCENVNAGEYLAMWAHLTKVTPWENYLLRFNPENDWNNKRVLLVRPGGFGDLLFLTPLMREMKKRWPGIRIGVSCSVRCAAVLESNPDVSVIHKYPLALTELDDYAAVLCFENAIEYGPLAHTHHAVDVFADVAGMELKDRKLRLHLLPEEIEAAKTQFPRTGKKRIGIQLFSSSPVRNYVRMGEVLHLLAKRNVEIFIFAAPGQNVVKTSYPNIVNLHALEKPLSFRESCAALTTCDALISPDSSMTHVAAALDVPCVALYGSFPWKLRITPGPKMTALTGNAECAPCFHHGRPKQIMPAQCPGKAEFTCHALSRIDPEWIVRAVAKYL